MDERSHHQHSMPPAQDGRGFRQQQDRPSPWPGAAPASAHDAPIAGAEYRDTQAWHAQPGMPSYPQAASLANGHGTDPQGPARYAYAPGFVMPGAASGQAPRMSAHGATIGTPQAPGGAPLHHGFAHAPEAWQHGATAAVAAHEPPQAWAYQTPHGLQLVQPGAAAYAHQPDAFTGGRPARRRVRWETIVPAAAVTCLVAAIGLFISDFDRMTGRDGAGAEATAARTTEAPDVVATDAAPTSGGDSAEVVAQARGLFERGRFEDAANMLHPLLDTATPDPTAVRLHDQVDAAATRNRALLGRLSRERAAGRWTAVVSTIGELQSLRPLSKDLVALRATARRTARAQAIVAKARTLMAKRRDAEALAVVERGLANGRNRKLEALREQLSARMSAPSTARSNPAGSRGAPPRPGGAAARPSAPARPPSNVPQGAIPTRPDLPNPTGGGASVAPAVGAGGGAGGTNCHEHDGVRECH